MRPGAPLGGQKQRKSWHLDRWSTAAGRPWLDKSSASGSCSLRIHDSHQEGLAVTTFSSLKSLISLLILTGCLALSLSVPGEERPESTSIGDPNNGRIEHAIRMPDHGTGFIMNPGTTNRDAIYGTRELVDAIAQIGADVERQAPGATLIVNDLSLEEGGTIPHHQSHQAGRDVDLLFFMKDEGGEILRSRAVRFDGSGVGMGDATGVRFDVARNWMVLRSLIENDDAHLQRVFVAERLRTLMLDWARSEAEPAWVIERAGEVMCEPAVPHDDHFHVRLFCTAEDYRQGCRDSWPIFPWRRTELSPLGISNVETAIPRPRTKRSRRRRPARATIGRVWCP